MESSRAACEKASQATSAMDTEGMGVLGAVAGAELGVSAAVRHLSIFKRSKGSLLQAPENPENEFQMKIKPGN